MGGTKSVHCESEDRPLAIASSPNMHDSHHDQTISISSLPNEILGSIFEHGHALTRFFSKPFEIQVCQVNQRWRDVATSTRLLWSCVSLMLPGPCYTAQTRQLALYLQRSGNAALDVRIDISTSHWDTLSPDDSLLIDLIMESALRSRSMRLRFHDLKVIGTIMGILQTFEAPILRSFEVVLLRQIELTSNRSTYQYIRNCNIFMHGAPALQCVYFQGCGLHQGLPPLTGVTSLTLMHAITGTFIEWEDFQESLNGHPCLTSLTLGDIFSVDDVSHNPANAMVLPSLISLQIYMSAVGSPYVEEILLTISTPKLQTLDLKEMLLGGLQDICSHVDGYFLPLLQSLHVGPKTRDIIPIQIWRELFAIFPTVTQLTLDIDILQLVSIRNFLEALSTTHPEFLIPQLRTLALAQYSETLIKPLCDVMQNRSCSVQAMQTLQLPAIEQDESLSNSFSIFRQFVEVKDFFPGQPLA